MLTSLEFRSECPLAKMLDVVGDKWSLLIIRDLAMGKSTYSELESSAEGITTSVLSTRLKMLTSIGLIEKQLYQTKPKRYQYLLTEKGQSLVPLLKAIVCWAEENICQHEHLASSKTA